MLQDRRSNRGSSKRGGRGGYRGGRGTISGRGGGGRGGAGHFRRQESATTTRADEEPEVEAETGGPLKGILVSPSFPHDGVKVLQKLPRDDMRETFDVVFVGSRTQYQNHSAQFREQLEFRRQPMLAWLKYFCACLKLYLEVQIDDVSSYETLPDDLLKSAYVADSRLAARLKTFTGHSGDALKGNKDFEHILVTPAVAECVPTRSQGVPTRFRRRRSYPDPKKQKMRQRVSLKKTSTYLSYVTLEIQRKKKKPLLVTFYDPFFFPHKQKTRKNRKNVCFCLLSNSVHTAAPHLA